MKPLITFRTPSSSLTLGEQARAARARAHATGRLARGSNVASVEVEAPSFNRLPRAPITETYSAKEYLTHFVYEATWEGPTDLGVSLIEAATAEAKATERARLASGIEEALADVTRRYKGADGEVLRALETLRTKLENL